MEIPEEYNTEKEVLDKIFSIRTTRLNIVQVVKRMKASRSFRILKIDTSQ